MALMQSAYVQNALEQSGQDPRSVVRDLGQLGLQKKKQRESFEEDRRRWEALHKLDLEKFALSKTQGEDAMRRAQEELGLKRSQVEFEPKRYLLGEGYGTPEERGAVTKPYGFSDQISYQVPGTGGRVYGADAARLATAGGGGGGGGGGGTSNVASEIARLEQLASSYSFSNPLSQGHQIYSNLRNRIAELSRQL